MTRWLDDRQQAAWRKLITVVELLPGKLDSQLRRDADLSHFDYFTLAMLSEAPGRSLRMTALAELTDASLPRLSHVASRLESKGYLTRTPSLDDRRATDATLTDAGWQKVVETAPGHASRVLDIVFAGLDERDVADLDRIMSRVLETLADTPDA